MKCNLKEKLCHDVKQQRSLKLVISGFDVCGNVVEERDELRSLERYVMTDLSHDRGMSRQHSELNGLKDTQFCTVLLPKLLCTKESRTGPSALCTQTPLAQFYMKKWSHTLSSHYTGKNKK